MTRIFFKGKMADAFKLRLFKNRSYADVTFVVDGIEVKANKCVLVGSCDYFQHFFDKIKVNRIHMNDTSFKAFNEVINYCYLDKIDITEWLYKEKKDLYNLAIKYNFESLMALVKIELEKPSKVPFSVETLNELNEMRSPEEIRGWVEDDLSNILSYKDCHKYSKDLIILIVDTLNKIYDTESDRCKLPSVRKEVLNWLFRWRNSPNRKEDDVQSIYQRIKWPSAIWLYFQHPRETEQEWKTNHTTPKEILAMLHFWRYRKVDTASWTCEEILQFLNLAHTYDFGSFSDALENVVGTHYLKPASLVAIHGKAFELDSRKLQQIIVDYMKIKALDILSSEEFTTYPASVVGFIMDNLKDHVMDSKTKTLMFTNIWNWMTSKSAEEVKLVFSKVYWEDYSREDVAGFFKNLLSNDNTKDFTFVLGSQAIKAHKFVLTYSCDYFKQFFEQNKSDRIDLNESSLKLLNAIIKYCYLQTINIADWRYTEKFQLYELAIYLNYLALKYFVKAELGKCPEIPLCVESLNEWFEKRPQKEIREWVKENLANIVDYQDCQKYPKDLMDFILTTFYEMYNINEENLRTARKKLLSWVFRWRDSCNRTNDEVRSLIPNIKWNIVLDMSPPSERTQVQALLLYGVSDFFRRRNSNTAGWTPDQVIQLLCLAHKYKLEQLLNAVLNEVDTKCLTPASLLTIHNINRKLESIKLNEVLVEYIKNSTMNILSSAEFINYPGSFIGFILENLMNEKMDIEAKILMLNSIRKWKSSKSKEEVKKVFDKVRYVDFLDDSFADVSEYLFNDETSKDVTFVFGKYEIKAHKMVVAYSCDHFEQLFNTNKENRIIMQTTSFMAFKEVVNYCYLEKINISQWCFSEKKDLFNLAKYYKFQSLIESMHYELQKSSEVRFTVNTLNELYEKKPRNVIRKWVKENIHTIVSNAHCSHYSEELVVFIRDTFYDMYDNCKNKRELNVPKRNLHPWIFQWIKSSNGKDDYSVLENIRWEFVPYEQKPFIGAFLKVIRGPKARPDQSKEQRESRGTKRKHE